MNKYKSKYCLMVLTLCKLNAGRHAVRVLSESITWWAARIRVSLSRLPNITPTAS